MSREHNWLEYDENHRGCPRCGLRVFRSPTVRGWVLVNYWGVPTSNLLADVAGGFGSCVPPPIGSELVVLIDYTGDPDLSPGCERFMHRIPDAHVPSGRAGAGGSALVLLGSVLPVCGYRPVWWELGPPRKHIGWTWCADCFPEERIKARRSDRETEPRPELPPARGWPSPKPLLDAIFDGARPARPALPSGLVEVPDRTSLIPRERLTPPAPASNAAPVAVRKPKSRNVVHLIESERLSLCGRMGVKMVTQATFACIPDKATGNNPRRCAECLRRGSL